MKSNKIKESNKLLRQFIGHLPRFDCWSYHPQLRKWSFLTNLPHGRTLIFPAVTTDDDKRNLFLAGGRL